MVRLNGIVLTCGALLFFTIYTDGATMCYNCNHVAHPRDCDRVVQCNAGETCHAIAYAQSDGNFYYNVGCLKKASCPVHTNFGRRDLAICDKCCEGSYCNREICDGPPPTEHGPRCLQCHTVEHPSQCGAVTECAKGQVCFTREKYVFGERRYQLGCANPTCSPLAKRSLSERRQAGQCEKCCSTENCNRDLCGSTGSPLTQAPITAPVYVPTTHKPMTTQHMTSKPVTSQPQTQPPQPGSTHVFNLHGCHYKGKVYQQNQTWEEGCEFRCTCFNATLGRYTCQDICPTYINVPDRCTMEKDPGACCPHPVCKGVNFTTTTNYTSTALNNECFYEGAKYKQDEVWHDGCEWECNCVDASRGYYKCHSMCYSWNLPAACHLNPPATGKCCKTPSCPAGYTISYPPGYVVN